MSKDMTQEEKDLIHKDACGRILYRPYGAYEFEGELIKVQITGIEGDEPWSPFYGYSFDTWGHIPHDNVKLYLRPVSSMTEEETNELYKAGFCDNEGTPYDIPGYIDYLNAHHFDYRELIEKGLALEAPKDMYKIE